MAQAKVDKSANVRSASATNSEKTRTALTGTPPKGPGQQMVQGAKSEPNDGQMGAGTRIFTDWASI